MSEFISVGVLAKLRSSPPSAPASGRDVSHDESDVDSALGREWPPRWLLAPQSADESPTYDKDESRTRLCDR